MGRTTSMQQLELGWGRKTGWEKPRGYGGSHRSSTAHPPPSNVPLLGEQELCCLLPCWFGVTVGTFGG